jgi:hypothetical protein
METEMSKQIVINLFLGVLALCGIIGVIGCDNFEAVIAEIIEPDPIEPAANEWVGTWALESYQGLSLLETLPEYDDYDDEDWTLLDVDGSVVDGDLLVKAITAFWSGDGVTGYDGAISYSFHADRTMEIEITIRLQMQVGAIQGVLVGKDQIPGSYSLIGSAYTTEIFDEVETGTWQRTGDALILNPDGADGLTVLRKL